MFRPLESRIPASQPPPRVAGASQAPPGGPPHLPEYFEAAGELDLNTALWLWMGYRRREWQEAEFRLTRTVSDTGAWIWGLEIVLPIEGQPGLELRGVAQSVRRLPLEWNAPDLEIALEEQASQAPPAAEPRPAPAVPARRSATTPTQGEPQPQRRRLDGASGVWAQPLSRRSLAAGGLSQGAGSAGALGGAPAAGTALRAPECTP